MNETSRNIFEEEKEEEVEVTKVYQFPSNLAVHKHGDIYLVIYTEGVSWLVLKTEEEWRIFQKLQEGHSIGDILDTFDGDAAIHVITQIEAKHFDHPSRKETFEKNIYIYLTNRCNERCRHCYMYAGDVAFEELSPEQWKQVLKDFKDHGGHGVTFTGGEVMVYQGFGELLKYAHGIGLQVAVLSNGTLWKKEDILSAGACIDEIQISLDGYDKISYERVRNYDGFDKALRCVKEFYEVGTKVSIAVTPLYDALPEFVERFEPFARKLLATYPDIFIKLNLELIQGREVHLSSDENQRYRETLRDMVERLYPEFYTETFALNYEDHIVRKNCGFGEISIAADGRVYWCNRIHELSSSRNVLDVGFERLFDVSKKIMESTSVDRTCPCKICDVRYICGGGCRMKYAGIRDVENHDGDWQTVCRGKDKIYDKMVKSNDFFYE